MDKKKLSAIILEIPVKTNGYFYVVEDEQGTLHSLRGMGAPCAKQIGDRGFVEYNVFSNGAHWFWISEEQE